MPTAVEQWPLSNVSRRAVRAAFPPGGASPIVNLELGYIAPPPPLPVSTRPLGSIVNGLARRAKHHQSRR